jgi:CBS-domain-containing membrane protein
MIKLQNMTVKEACHLDIDDPILLKVDNEFDQVIKNFAQHVELRGMFVLDQDNRFIGVITRTDLLDWTRATLGQVILKPLSDMNKTIRLVSLVGASKVGDILRPETRNAAVREDNTLDQALKIMVETDLILLPVVDDSQRVIGRLRLSELLNLALD